MKRYLLFGGERYYPSGGWEDFREDFDRRTDANNAALKLHSDWWQIVDTKTKKIIKEYYMEE
jgi:hypothetical protein